jgi:hypothetical protein
MLQITCSIMIRKNHSSLEHDHVILMCQGDPIGTPTTTFSVLVLFSTDPVLLSLCALGVMTCTQQNVEVIHMNKMLGKQRRLGGLQHMFHWILCRGTSIEN